MASFYFSKVLVFKISSAGVKDEKRTLPPQLLVSNTMPVPVATIPLVLEAVGGVLSSLTREESLNPSKNVLRQDKRKRIAKDEGKKVVPVVEDEYDAVDSMRTK
ncbi:hypothetical protein Adt_13764 [Abeliophyllum distichum]|uniref:Uncharacterized protein n=1 Tax=Abeliophyllum distichum TaxID=126358 RepID=A0ABD1TXQ3_9LAMI